MSSVVSLDQVGILPVSADNSAIARRRLDAGTAVDIGGTPVVLTQTIPEGHRFVVAPVQTGAPLTSWGFSFGRATVDLSPGDYLCNRAMIEELQRRSLDFEVPTAINFVDDIEPFDPATLQTSIRPATPADSSRTFEGFLRSDGRGVGTRNCLVILGVNAMAGPMAKLVASRLKELHPDLPAGLDGIVAIAHTEGGETGAVPNNIQYSLRALAGLIVHPNVGAVLAMDTGHGPLTIHSVRSAARESGLPLGAVPMDVLRLSGDPEADLDRALEVVRPLIPIAASASRTSQPVSALNIGLQCGGSDAFNGVSSNPLAGVVAREVVLRGGRANLAETDELMGAEPYILKRIAGRSVGETFLRTLEQFEARCAAHGVSGKSNPSGGNVYRGLYNIALKSLGAARKKDPALWLDAVIDYAEPMIDPGFHFMNSPGNDLESISGQVAAGCNLIAFSTGNGSITNHPLVPTVKIMSNSARFELLSREMDFNGGRFLDGEAFEELGAELFDLALEIASGRRSTGERAGHAQVQFWREWRQTSTGASAKSRGALPSGELIEFRSEGAGSASSIEGVRAGSGVEPARVRLIIPTSLCAGQIALQIAARMNAEDPDARAVALPHTEGCGVSGEAIEIVERVLAGYAAHPLAESVLLLEHGCEKTHNQSMQRVLAARGVDIRRIGFASIQLDGGIDRVGSKVRDWFKTPGVQGRVHKRGPMRIGLLSTRKVDEPLSEALANVCAVVIAAGGSVLIPETDLLLSTDAFTRRLAGSRGPTLPHGGSIGREGFHIMAMAGTNPVEAVTGLGASGAGVIVRVGIGDVRVEHPFLPDCEIGDAELGSPDSILNRIVAAEAGGARMNRAVDFQVNRGAFGVST